MGGDQSESRATREVVENHLAVYDQGESDRDLTP